MQTVCRPSSVDWGLAKAVILLLLVLQTLMLSCPTPGETAGWKATGPLTGPRGGHTATLLGNGQVLVAGGMNSSGHLNTAELYDPVAKTWSGTGVFTTGRYNHTATLLGNGQVLMAGGVGAGSSFLTSANLYTLSQNTWAPTGAFTPARSGHTATLLGNNKVLVAGGYNPSFLTSAVLYTAPNWNATINTLAIARTWHTATLLGNGQVLVAGGYNGSSNPPFLASAELYNPDANTWSGTTGVLAPGQLATARIGHTATLLGNGQVLVVGGQPASGPILTSAELYDPATKTWSGTGQLATARSGHTATLLGNGKVLVAGGTNSIEYVTMAELYDPATKTWSNTGALATGRYGHTATLLGNGQVLVAGGTNSSGQTLTSAELYQVDANLGMRMLLLLDD